MTSTCVVCEQPVDGRHFCSDACELRFLRAENAKVTPLALECTLLRNVAATLHGALATVAKRQAGSPQELARCTWCSYSTSSCDADHDWCAGHTVRKAMEAFEAYLASGPNTISTAEVCQTCGRGAQYAWYCSSGFHICRACTWRDGERLTTCRDCASFEEPLGTTRVRHAVGQLRHLYAQMVNGHVKDAADAARGLLGPSIETLETALHKLPPVVVSDDG